MVIHIIFRGPYILRPRDRIFYALKTVKFQLKTVYIPSRPYIFRRDRKFYFSGPYIFYFIIKLLAVPMLVKNVGEKCMLAKNLYIGENLNFSRTYFSSTNRKMFTNIHLNFCLHQHTASTTYFFSPTYFTNITTAMRRAMLHRLCSIIFLKPQLVKIPPFFTSSGRDYLRGLNERFITLKNENLRFQRNLLGHCNHFRARFFSSGSPSLGHDI